MKITEIITDETLRELRSHGTLAFPFEYYYDDIHKYDKSYIEWHWHNEFEWVYVEAGIVDCMIGNERIQLNQGDGIFINSKVIHRFESESGALMPNILFSPEFIAPKISSIFTEYLIPVLDSACTYISFRSENEKENNVLQSLCKIFGLAELGIEDNKLDIQISSSILWRDFIIVMDNRLLYCAEDKNMLIQSRIRTMIQFIGDNYKRKITLDEISESANISKSEALRCFHIGIQTTPVKYLVDYRLNRAKDLLLTTDNTITQIAVDVGIDNISYFVRIFTSKYGVTPKKYRYKYGEVFNQ